MLNSIGNWKKQLPMHTQLLRQLHLLLVIINTRVFVLYLHIIVKWKCFTGTFDVNLDLKWELEHSSLDKMVQFDFEKHKYFLCVTVSCVVYLIFGYAAQLLCNAISVAYPAYISIRAIESSDKIDDTKWLTYWVLYATFSIIEFFSLFLTNFIPFYFLLKCIFFIWCMLPIENNGSIIIYNRIIRPQFVKHHQSTDKLIDTLTNKAKDVATDILSKNK